MNCRCSLRDLGTDSGLTLWTRTLAPGLWICLARCWGRRPQFLAGGSEKPDGGRLVLRFYLVPGWHA